MVTFKQRLERRRIFRLVQPLDFYYDKVQFKSDTEYLINWLGNIGISAMNISNDNSYSDILAVNIMGDKQTTNMYCISLLLYPSIVIDEEYLLGLKEEAEKYKAIPVLFLVDDLDKPEGLLANSFGIQIVTSSQLNGMNKLLVENNIPDIDINTTLFIRKMAYYIRMKLS